MWDGEFGELEIGQRGKRNIGLLKGIMTLVGYYIRGHLYLGLTVSRFAARGHL